MKKKIIFYIMIFLFVCSSISLTFNVLNLTSKLNSQKKYEKNITNNKKSRELENKKLEEVKSEYETIKKSNTNKIEDYQAWEKKNEEIKSYIK